MILKEISPPKLPLLEWKGSYEEEVFVAREIGRSIVGYFVPYRYLYAYTMDLEWRKVLPFIPVGVNGFVRRGKEILFGRRGASVTKYAGWWELPPSGSISRGDEGLDPVLHLLKELREETGIVKVKEIRPLVEMINQELCSFDLCFEIEVLEEGNPTEEYDELFWLKESDSLDRIEDEVVPLSRTLFTRYAKK